MESRGEKYFAFLGDEWESLRFISLHPCKITHHIIAQMNLQHIMLGIAQLDAMRDGASMECKFKFTIDFFT